MIQELQIPTALGFCKNCFRSKRDGSAYCGQCQNEKPRPKIYLADRSYFPLTNEVMKELNLTISDLTSIVFTYGNTICADNELSVPLLAHELTHVFQQMKIGRKEWWKRYLKSDKFRLKQEIEAYRQQYKVLKQKDPAYAEIELVKLARDLSSKLYGGIISPMEAINKIIA